MKMDEIIMRILTKTNSYDDIVEFAQWLNADEKTEKNFKNRKLLECKFKI